MNIAGYSINIEDAAQEIKDNNYKKVAVQIPEGLRRHAFALVDFLEKETQARVIIVADPCYGACDLANHELRNLAIEFVIHIGHTPIPTIETFAIPTVFVTAESTVDVSRVIEKSLPFLEGEKIGVVTTAQHFHTLHTVTHLLEKHKFTPIFGEGDARISEKGQILGCNFSAGTNIVDKVDSFLFIGSGTFHPLGLLLATGKTVVAADPYTSSVQKEELEELKDMILRQRYGAIARSKDAKRFGILVGLKRGQQRIDLAYKIQKMLTAEHKKSYILTMDNFSSVLLQGFGTVDCFVSTACSRVAIDDYAQYKVPILTPIELEIALGKRKWEEYTFDQILG